MYPFHEQTCVKNEYHIKLKQWIINPGERRNHRVNGKTGVYDLQLLLPNEQWPGLTKFVMFRAKGLPVSGKNGTPATTCGFDNVNYASDPPIVTGKQ